MCLVKCNDWYWYSLKDRGFSNVFNNSRSKIVHVYWYVFGARWYVLNFCMFRWSSVANLCFLRISFLLEVIEIWHQLAKPPRCEVLRNLALTNWSPKILDITLDFSWDIIAQNLSIFENNIIGNLWNVVLVSRIPKIADD